MSIKAKYSAYYLNNVSKPGKIKKGATATQLMHGTEIPISFLMTNNLSTATVRAMSGNRCEKYIRLSTRTVVGLKSLGIIART